MTHNGRCSRRRHVAPVLATSLLSGCATVGSYGRAVGTYPPLVEYSRDVQTRAAEELTLLPEGAVIMEMLSDYAVMRAQARACRPP